MEKRLFKRSGWTCGAVMAAMLFLGFYALLGAPGIFLAATPAQGQSASRVFEVPDPLFQELIGTKPPPLAGQGALLWDHEGLVTPFAIQYGMEFSREAMVQRWAASKLHRISSEGANGLPFLDLQRQYGAKPILYPFNYISGANCAGVPEDDTYKWPFILDPCVEQNYLAGLQNVLSLYQADAYGVQDLDEGIEKISSQAKELYNKHLLGEVNYPFIVQCNEEVKNTYGFGIYGIPTTHLPGSNTAFNRLAFRRWVVAKALARAQTTYQVIKAANPGLLVFSYGSSSKFRAFQFSLWKGCFDVLLHQMNVTEATLKPYLTPFGFNSKYASDLSGLPFWAVPHVNEQSVANSPKLNVEECRELFSQVIRNGGTGLDIYMHDGAGAAGLRKYYYYSDLYGAPERYRAAMETVDLLSRMNRLNFPTADCAVLLSNDTEQGKDYWDTSPAHLYAYMFLGPYARSWFQVIDDDQVGSIRPKDLLRFKAIFMPAAKIQRPNVINKLRNYVGDGGNLVCTDPEVWTYQDNGESATGRRNDLFGVMAMTPASHTSVTFTPLGPKLPAYTLQLCPGAVTNNLTPARGAVILARYEDGSPAVVAKRTGSGKTMLFGFNPFMEEHLQDQAWREFFRAFQKSLGVRTGQDIWRFKLPPFQTTSLQPEPGRCLTGNYLFWSLGVPNSVNNVDTGATYSLNPKANSSPDVGVTDIPVSAGKLTNRLQAPVVGNYETDPQDDNIRDSWVIRWTNTQAITITFDFKGHYPVDRVKLFYQGQMPATGVWVSEDGVNWQEAGVDDTVKEASTTDVGLRTLTFNPVWARFVRLDLGARDTGKSLTLSEVEVWASPE